MAQPPSPETLAPKSGERIAKLLARAGVASRREVERMITEGRVKLNDQVLTTPATVLPNLRGVTVDDRPVRAAEAARLFLFHKPSGLLTAERDHSGRPTIYAALRNALPEGTARMMPIGRLDFNTEGLLILTNDGELKRAMELPSTGIPRTYRARTFGTVSQEELEALSDGIEIEGIRYGSINANMERSTGRNQWIEVTITEGKNREVRRVLEHLGLEVSRLIRTSYGPFHLLDLPRGMAVEVKPADVEKFTKALATGTTGDIRVETMLPAARPVRSTPERLAAAPARGRARPDSGRSDRERPERPRGDFGKPGGGEARRGPARDGARRDTAGPNGGLSEQRRGPARSLRQAGERTGHPERASFRSAEGAPSSPRGAAADRAGKPARPPRKSDERDRGEKLLDRPKAPRKPSGWAKAKPKTDKFGRPVKPGPRK